MAQIRIPTPLRKFTANAKDVNVSATTVIEAFQELVEQFPDIKNHVLTEEGSIRKFIRVYVEESDIDSLNGDQTTLQNENTISIIPAIAGGKQ